MSAEVLRARGSWRANQVRTPLDSEPGDLPEPPENLGPEGRKMFDFVKKRLSYTGVLSIADWPLIVRYCLNWERWLRATDHLGGMKAEMMPIKTREGKVVGGKGHPLSAVADNLDSALLRAENALGLNVLSRARITADASTATLNVRKLQEQMMAPARKDVDPNDPDQLRAYFMGPRP